MDLPWTRLIRFISTDGRTLRGEPVLPSSDYDLGNLKESDGIKAKVLEGEALFGPPGCTHLTGEEVTVKKILGPLTKKDVPIIRCVGLNYLKHIREGGRNPPPYPQIFYKPTTCLNDHDAPVIVPKLCQDDQADYEGEMCFIIGKDAKDVPTGKGLDYIAAYTCGNDMSSRKWQRDPAFAGGVPQWCFSKSFDGYAPLGPCLVSSKAFPDPSKFHLKTIVDGSVRQSETCSDLCFDCGYLVEFLSQGTTIEAGTVVMTGTPGGVGFAMKPATYLKHGNVVEVSIPDIGTLRNRIEFAK